MLTVLHLLPLVQVLRLLLVLLWLLLPLLLLVLLHFLLLVLLRRLLLGLHNLVDELRQALDAGADMALLLNAWGTFDAAADLSGDGIVGGSDLGMLLNAWGACR